MDRRVKVILSVACIALFTLGSVNAATVTVDPSQTWNGYMNWYNVGGAGYGIAGAGSFVFGTGWGTGDLRASFAAGPSNPLTLQCNTIGDPNSFWYQGGGAPGAIGNKVGEANMYVEQTGPLAGQAVTFTGIVLGNSLLGPTDAQGRGWTTYAFIKDFDAGYGSFNVAVVPITSLGTFSVTLNTINDLARHVQYGFATTGPDVWAGDPLTALSVQVTAIPEPSSIALAMTGLLGLAAFVWKRRS